MSSSGLIQFTDETARSPSAGIAWFGDVENIKDQDRGTRGRLKNAVPHSAKDGFFDETVRFQSVTLLSDIKSSHASPAETPRMDRLMNRSTAICDHFRYTRDELMVLIAARQLRSPRGILARFGQGSGCATCLNAIEQMLKDLRTSQQLRRTAWESTERLASRVPALDEEFSARDFRTRSVSECLHLRYARIRQMYSLEMVVTDDLSASSPAQWADIGVIVRADEYQIYLCGQGGECPRSGFLLAMCRTQEQLVRCLDRFLMYYILTSDPYTRTTPWIDMLIDGTQHLRRVIVVDTLRVGVELDDMFQTFAGAGCLAADFTPQDCHSFEEVAHVHLEVSAEAVIS